MSWNNRSYFGGQSGNRQYSSCSDDYGGGQHEGIGGKKRPSSRLKKSGGKKADADYPGYTTHGGYNDNHNNNYSSYGNGGYGSSPYNNGYGSATTPYYGGRGGGGYDNSNSSYSNDGGGYAGGADVRPYNAPAAIWAPQDGTPSPMFINTEEVNVYGMPGSQYGNGYNNDQRRRGGRGLFRPAFEAVGHFFDRKFGFNDRD